MVYVDTSVLVALFLHEPHSAAVADWYANERSELAAAAWCVPEFAARWASSSAPAPFGPRRLKVLPVEPAHFHRAAALVLDAASALRAVDALHLACAEAAGVKQMATLEEVLSRNAVRVKIEPVFLSSE